MTDLPNAYEEPLEEPLGVSIQKHAENASALIKFLGGPVIDPNALAKIFVDLRAWWIK